MLRYGDYFNDSKSGPSDACVSATMYSVMRLIACEDSNEQLVIFLRVMVMGYIK